MAVVTGTRATLPSSLPERGRPKGPHPTSTPPPPLRDDGASLASSDNSYYRFLFSRPRTYGLRDNGPGGPGDSRWQEIRAHLICKQTTVCWVLRTRGWQVRWSIVVVR